MMSWDPVQKEKDQQRHMWAHPVCMAGHSADRVWWELSREGKLFFFLDWAYSGPSLCVCFITQGSLKGHWLFPHRCDKEQSDGRGIYLGDTLRLREKSSLVCFPVAMIKH